MVILIEDKQDKVRVTNELNRLIREAVEISIETEEFKYKSEVSICIVDNETIRQLNKNHRCVDMSTDVLSFPMIDMSHGTLDTPIYEHDMDEGRVLLGDIVISVEMVEKQANEYGHSFERELAFLTTHGVFHLLGYNHTDEQHEKIMMEKQENVLRKMNLLRNI